MLSFRNLRWLFWVTGFLIWFDDAVEGHGYVKSPRSRNWVAYEDGIEGQQAGVPRREYCAHCLNRNSGACGNSPTYNYDQWLDSKNVPMPWKSEATYVGGSTIRVRTYLTTNHAGHMELRACPKGRASTWDCFDDSKNRLTFVKDYLYDVPADPKYPERGYYAGYDKQLKEFDMEFRLPDALVGEKVLLQWRYITANSCTPPGYTAYFNGANSQSKVLPEGWYGKLMQACVLPYPRDGSVGGAGVPEQFFNCMEVTILPPTPSVSRAPTRAPTLPPTKKTSAPVGKTPTKAPAGPTKSPVGAAPTRRPVATPTRSPVAAPTRSPVGGGGSGGRCCPNGYSGHRAFDGCKSFYQCDSGRIVGGVTSCPSATLFDAKLSVCNWASAVKNCVVDSCVAPAPARSSLAQPTPTRSSVAKPGTVTEAATTTKKRPG